MAAGIPHNSPLLPAEGGNIQSPARSCCPSQRDSQGAILEEGRPSPHTTCLPTGEPPQPGSLFSSPHSRQDGASSAIGNPHNSPLLPAKAGDILVTCQVLLSLAEGLTGRHLGGGKAVASHHLPPHRGPTTARASRLLSSQQAGWHQLLGGTFLGQEEPSTSVNVRSRGKQAPQIQSDPQLLSMGPAATPSTQGGKRGHNPFVGR